MLKSSRNEWNVEMGVIAQERLPEALCAGKFKIFLSTHCKQTHWPVKSKGGFSSLLLTLLLCKRACCGHNTKANLAVGAPNPKQDPQSRGPRRYTQFSIYALVALTVLALGCIYSCNSSAARRKSSIFMLQ